MRYAGNPIGVSAACCVLCTAYLRAHDCLFYESKTNLNASVGWTYPGSASAAAESKFLSNLQKLIVAVMTMMLPTPKNVASKVYPADPYPPFES